MQGVIKSYDPTTQDGVVLDDVNLEEYELAPRAMEGTVFRMLRPGQRIVFDVSDTHQAVNIRLGSEIDMATPVWEDSEQ